LKRIFYFRFFFRFPKKLAVNLEDIFNQSKLTHRYLVLLLLITRFIFSQQEPQVSIYIYVHNRFKTGDTVSPITKNALVTEKCLKKNQTDFTKFLR
jgi:hypothetical protein